MSIHISDTEMVCPGCGGETSWICDHCAGNGCHDCHSDGTTTCTVCDGTGKLAWEDAQWMLRSIDPQYLALCRETGRLLERDDTRSALAEDAADAGKEALRERHV